MITDAKKLVKLQNAVRQMVADGRTSDEIDSVLAEFGETPDSMRIIGENGAEAVANARKSREDFEEEWNKPLNVAQRTASDIGAGVRGALEGALTGTERVLNSRTLGGYGWLNKKIGGNYEKRQQEQQEAAQSVGLGGLNKAANLMADIGGVIKSPIYRVLPDPMKAKTMLGTLGRGALQGGVASGIQSAFVNDSLKDVPKQTTIGALIGGVGSSALRGVGELGSLLGGATTGKGSEAIKSAYSAGQRGSKAFKMGRHTTAEEIVETAKSGREEIQKAASRAINEGKNAIGNNPVDKQGLYNSLHDFYRERFLHNGTNLASKGERKVLKEAETIINRLTRKKNIDVKTVDALKQQIWKIVPEASNDRAALATRDGLYSVVSKYLNKASPEYDAIMKPYSVAMDELGKIASEAGIKERGTKIATSINKLIKTSKNPENAQIIQKLGGQNLADTLAGYDLRNYLPDTQIGRAIATGVMGLGLGTGGSAFWWLPLMSPRLVGNIAYGLGATSKFAPSAQSTANILNYLRLNNSPNTQDEQ